MQWLNVWALVYDFESSPARIRFYKMIYDDNRFDATEPLLCYFKDKLNHSSSFPLERKQSPIKGTGRPAKDQYRQIMQRVQTRMSQCSWSPVPQTLIYSRKDFIDTNNKTQNKGLILHSLSALNSYKLFICFSLKQ